MPSWSTSRQRLMVTEAELESLARTPAAFPLSETAAEMAQIVARPARRVLVQIFTAAARPLTHRIWSTGGSAVVSTATGDGQAELSLTDPALIPFLIAHLVGIRRVRPPEGREPIHVPLTTYRAVEAGAPGLPQLSAVLGLRRLSWRVSAALPDATQRPHVKWLHVTDAGRAGLWRLVVDHSKQDVMLTPTRAREVWSVLTREVLS